MTFDLQLALNHLRADSMMAELVKRYQPPGFLGDTKGNIVADLIEAIISQQLSDKAAATIIGRFKLLFSADSYPDITKIIELPEQRIRDCGLSFSKVRCVQRLCREIHNRNLELDHIWELDDEAVISELTKIKGIGRWTAEMILIFSLKRPDVFAAGDAGLRKAVGALYGVDRSDVPAIISVVNRFRPYRSLACHYLWKSLDE